MGLVYIYIMLLSPYKKNLIFTIFLIGLTFNYKRKIHLKHEIIYFTSNSSIYSEFQPMAYHVKSIIFRLITAAKT